MQKETGVTLAPQDVRRNVVTQGLALRDLVGREFKVGEVRLRGTRLSEPCRHLARLTDASPPRSRSPERVAGGDPVRGRHPPGDAVLES